jgi:hypothetical protein
MDRIRHGPLAVLFLVSLTPALAQPVVRPSVVPEDAPADLVEELRALEIASSSPEDPRITGGMHGGQVNDLHGLRNSGLTKPEAGFTFNPWEHRTGCALIPAFLLGFPTL